MNFSFTLNNTTGPYYVTYSPVICSLKLTDGAAGDPAVPVQLMNNATTGGQLLFYSGLGGQGSPAVTLMVPGDGEEITFYLSGKPMEPSTEDGDAGINVSVGGQSKLLVPMMVRVRKDANKLTPNERDSFLKAFTAFVTSGQYENFLAMHNEAAYNEIHGRASFLPWHRIFVLDLERHLQQIDASVSIPYWNFQYRAENVFTLDFMGVPANTSIGQLVFSGPNPLNNWRLPNLPRLARKPAAGFDPLQDKALVEDESVTLGRNPGFYQFREMEGNPHGGAHTSWVGPVDYPPTAPQDPLFFMLHSNVDRLWAAWQMQDPTNQLFISSNDNAYSPNSFPKAPAPRIGDFPDDTMWPWNNVKGKPRPKTAPAGHSSDPHFQVIPAKHQLLPMPLTTRVK